MSGDQQKDAVEKYASAIQVFLTGNANVREMVARSIIEPIATELSKSSDSSTANDNLDTLWNATLDIVQAIQDPYNPSDAQSISERALEILHGVHCFLDVTRSTPEQYKDIPQSGATQISKLPGFGIAVRDRFNGPAAGSPDAWTDLNAFLAVLWNSCDPESGYTQPEAYDYGLYAIWSLRDVLETEQPPEQLKILLPAAAAWILIAARTIVKSSGRKFPASPKTGAPARAGPLLITAVEGQGKDPKAIDGFDKGRWSYWQTKLNNLAEDDSLDADVRAIAKAAHQKMGTVEPNS